MFDPVQVDDAVFMSIPGCYDVFPLVTHELWLSVDKCAVAYSYRCLMYYFYAWILRFLEEPCHSSQSVFRYSIYIYISFPFFPNLSIIANRHRIRNYKIIARFSFKFKIIIINPYTQKKKIISYKHSSLWQKCTLFTVYSIQSKTK